MAGMIKGHPILLDNVSEHVGKTLFLFLLFEIKTWSKQLDLSLFWPKILPLAQYVVPTHCLKSLEISLCYKILPQTYLFLILPTYTVISFDRYPGKIPFKFAMHYSPQKFTLNWLYTKAIWADSLEKLPCLDSLQKLLCCTDALQK